MDPQPNPIVLSNPVLSINYRLWTWLGYLCPRDGRRYLTVIPSLVLETLQICYLLFADDTLDMITIYIYFAALHFNCLVIRWSKNLSTLGLFASLSSTVPGAVHDEEPSTVWKVSARLLCPLQWNYSWAHPFGFGVYKDLIKFRSRSLGNIIPWYWSKKWDIALSGSVDSTCSLACSQWFASRAIHFSWPVDDIPMA